MAADIQGQRKEARDQILAAVRWSYAFDTSKTDFSGAIRDICNCGLSIFTHKRVMKGRILEIYAKGLWDGPRYATVKWCNEIAPDVYRVGLKICRWL